MASYTKLLQVSKATYHELLLRDKQCIFCKLGYHMHPKYPNTMDCIIMDAMHYIPKSKMGLGILENLVLGCRYHHHMLDNGKGGCRGEMLNIMSMYLKQLYPMWSEGRLVYQKYGQKI